MPKKLTYVFYHSLFELDAPKVNGGDVQGLFECILVECKPDKYQTIFNKIITQ